MNKLIKTVLWLAIFSVAMGFMESAVVIYLRELYYPGGFRFPLAPVPLNITLVEFLRELATIIMLLSIGIIAGRNIAERFSFFLFCFAVWDLFYYIFLKLFLNWPESFFTWDILFFVPVPWIGPVLAPCIDSVTMIILTLAVVYFHRREVMVTINKTEWLLLIAGSVIQIVSYSINQLKYILPGNSSLWNPVSRQKMFIEICHYVPQSYSWGLFSIGELCILLGMFFMIKRHHQHHKKLIRAV